MTYSCQPFYKLVTGIKSPEVYVSQQERMDYYEAFFADSLRVELYTMKDVEALQYGFTTFKNYPQIYLVNEKEHKAYSVNCYDDVAYSIEQIEAGKYKNYLEDAEIKKRLEQIDEVIEGKTELVYQTGNELSSKPKNDSLGWQAFIVSGAFLGKKIRKKTLAFLELNNLTKLSLIDLSVNSTK